MMTTNLGISPVLSFIQLLVVALPVLAWIALYVRGAEARDLLFWGAIAVVIPILGPLAASIFALRLRRNKMKRAVSDVT